MPLRVVCSGCSRKLKAPDQAAGKKVKCPQCGTPVFIPSARSSTLSSGAKNKFPSPSIPNSAHDEDVAAWLLQLDASSPQLPTPTITPEPEEAKGMEGGLRQPREQRSNANQPAEEQGRKEQAAAQAQVKSNLRVCPDCDKMVSKRAAQCPGCGCPLSMPAVLHSSNTEAPALEAVSDSASIAPHNRGRRGSCSGFGLLVVGFLALVVAVVIEVNLNKADERAMEIWSSLRDLNRGVSLMEGRSDYTRPPEPEPSSRVPVYFTAGIGVFFIGLGTVVLALPRKHDL
jgi:DNA-directed RNA polymerase subunit RPC12/RpoP